MRIINKGVDPKTKPIMASCNRCKTVVEFMPNEAQYHSDPREDDFYTVVCPVCDSTISAQVRGVANYYTDH